MTTKVCPQCGQRVHDSTARFCDIDGSALTSLPPGTTPKSPTPRSPLAKGGESPYLYAGLAVAGLGMICAAGWILSGIGLSTDIQEIALDVGLEEREFEAPASVQEALGRCFGESIPPLPKQGKAVVDDLYAQTKEVLRVGTAIGASARPITLEEEIKYGQDTERALLKKHVISQARTPTARLERLAKRLIPLAPRSDVLDYHFTLIESDQINAMMAPGGRSFFFEGLLSAMPNDDHLAFVVGHELAHSELGHSTNQLSLILMGRELSEATLGGDLGTLGGIVSGVGTRMLHATYDQDLEYEADRLGICLAYLSGARPNAGVGATRALGANRDDRAPSSGASRIAYDIITSHPPPKDRQRYQLELARIIDERGLR